MLPKSKSQDTLSSGQTSLAFREIEPEDFQACSLIYSRSWNSALPAHIRNVNLKEFRNETEKDRTIVALQVGQIVGFISIFEPESFVHLLFVDPLLQGVGVGSALLNYAERISDGYALSLKCQTENTVALNFYRKLGFRKGSETGTNEYGEWILLVRSGEAED